MAKRTAEASIPVDSTKKARGDTSVENQQTVRVLIENHEAGAVIGKGGSKVTALREATGCALNIMKNEAQGPGSKERILVLKGSVEGNSLAVQMMLQYWIDSANTRKPREGEAPPAQVSDYTIKILILKFQAGCVIGKGGSRIKEIQSTTGAHIQLSNDPLPNSSEKTVSIKGSPDQVYAAATAVLTQLAENPPKPGTKSILYDPSLKAMAPPAMYDPYAGAYPGYPGAAPGMPAAPRGYAPVPQYGAPVGYGYPPAPSYGAPPSAAGGSEERIAIPSAMAGAIIGKGGSKIRDLNSQSGCRISIGKPEPTSPEERVVTISGPAENIQTAIFMIRQIVEQGY